MYSKVRAYPNGTVKYYYGDKVVIEKENGISYIKLTIFDKEQNEWLDSIPTNIPKYFPNKLHNNI